MSLKCPKCGREFDVTLFEYGRYVSCPCGEKISLVDGHVREGGRHGSNDEPVRGVPGVGIDWDSLEREIFGSVHDKENGPDRAAEFRRESDRIVSLILYSDMPRVDIEIQIRSFRKKVLALFPEKEELFNALYVSRFRRIWAQFRGEEESLEGV